MEFVDLGPGHERLGVESRVTRAGQLLTTIHRLRPVGDDQWVRVFSLNLVPQEARDLADLLYEVAPKRRIDDGIESAGDGKT